MVKTDKLMYVLALKGNSAIAVTDESEPVFTNTDVHRIAHISKPINIF